MVMGATAALMADRRGTPTIHRRTGGRLEAQVAHRQGDQAGPGDREAQAEAPGKAGSQQGRASRRPLLIASMP